MRVLRRQSEAAFPRRHSPTVFPPSVFRKPGRTSIAVGAGPPSGRRFGGVPFAGSARTGSVVLQRLPVRSFCRPPAFFLSTSFRRVLTEAFSRADVFSASSAALSSDAESGAENCRGSAAFSACARSPMTRASAWLRKTLFPVCASPHLKTRASWRRPGLRERGETQNPCPRTPRIRGACLFARIRGACPVFSFQGAVSAAPPFIRPSKKSRRSLKKIPRFAFRGGARDHAFWGKRDGPETPSFYMFLLR